jgi:hypothetical protein
VTDAERMEAVLETPVILIHGPLPWFRTSLPLIVPRKPAVTLSVRCH